MPPLNLTTDGDTQVLVTRRFAAPPDLVWRAHTDPSLIQRWMTGPDGWTMPRCESDPRPGGAFRFDWADGTGNGFHLTGEYLALDPGTRIVHVERMHMPDPTPDNHIETTFRADGDGTLLTLHMTLPNAETRTQMLATGMEHGMEASYAHLDSLLAT